MRLLLLNWGIAKWVCSGALFSFKQRKVKEAL
jgi:hypothetical protein